MLPVFSRFFAGLVCLSLVTVHSAEEAPAAAWATLLNGNREGMFLPRVVANPAGGFYLYSTGDRPLIKFNADYSLAWEIKNQPGINDVREFAQLDVLDNGDLIGIVDTWNTAVIFGRTFTASGRAVVRLRGTDGSPVFVRAVENGFATAVIARPAGGYILAGHGAGVVRIGTDEINVGEDGVFIAAFSQSVEWAKFGRGSAFSGRFAVSHLATSGAGPDLRVYAAGAASLPWQFDGEPIASEGDYLITLDGSGSVQRAASFGLHSSVRALEGNASGAYVTWLQDGARWLRRVDDGGVTLWENPLEADTWELAATADGVLAVGMTTGSANWFAMAFDDAGTVRWRRGERGRSASAAYGCAILNDGRFIVSGIAGNSGIFIDDFFLRDFSLLNLFTVGAFVTALEVNPNAAPIFKAQPRDQKFVVVGETVTLHTEVYAPAGYILKWFKDGFTLPGQTEPDLIILNAQPQDRGRYYAEASNGAGITKSLEVEVVVNSVSVSVFGGTDAPGLLSSPRSPVALPDGSILVADPPRNVIQKVSPTGVSVFAGMGVAGSAGGPPLQAQFSAPSAVALNLYSSAGEAVFVADRSNDVVRTIWFSKETGSAVRVEEGGPRFSGPTSLATTAGVLNLIVGESAAARLFKMDDGIPFRLAPQTEFGAIAGVALDERANVFVADAGKHLIQRIDPAGVVTTLAGSGGSGFENGAGAIATFNAPSGLALDESGNIYVADRENHAIRKVSPNGFTTTIAGLGASGQQNGTASEALFNAPEALCFRSDALIVADTGNHCLREVRFQPLDGSFEPDTKVRATMDEFLHISVSGAIGQRYGVESSAVIGSNAIWRSEGEVMAGEELLLPRPSATRYYRAERR